MRGLVTLIGMVKDWAETKYSTILPTAKSYAFRDIYILYRCFNKKDELLYVGKTLRPAYRFSEHKRDKHWWSKVVKIKLQHFKDSKELAKAETKAIKKEKPIYNSKHLENRE